MIWALRRLPEPIILLLGSMMSMASGLVAFLLASLWLDSAGFGAFTFVYNTSALFGASVGTSIVYYMMQRLRSYGGGKLLYLQAQGLITSAIIAFLAGGLIILSSAILAGDTYLALVAIAPMISGSVATTMSQLAIANLRGVVMLSINVFRTLSISGSIVIGGTVGGTDAMLVAYAIGSVLSTTILFLALHRGELTILAHARPAWWRHVLKRIRLFVPYISSSFVPVYLQSIVAIDLTKSPAGLRLSGFFNVGRQWQSVIQLMGSTLTSFFLPRMAGSLPDHRAMYLRNRALASAYALALPVASIVVVPILQHIYFGGTNADAASILYALVLWSALVQFVNPISNRNFASGLVWPAIVQNLGLSITYVLAYLLLPLDLSGKLVWSLIISACIQFLLMIAINFVNFRSAKELCFDIALGGLIFTFILYVQNSGLGSSF